MSFAKKLVTVAENTQRVYEAGDAKGTLYAAKICLGKTIPATYRLPDGVDRLGIYSVAYNSNLKYLTVPPSLTYVANSAFRNSTGLIEVIFEGGTINTWGSSEFNTCSALKKVHFGCSFSQSTNSPVTSGTFDGCTKLEEVTFADLELTGHMYVNPSAVFKKQCAYEIMRKMKDQTGTDKEFAYTVKFHNTVWTNIEDTTAEDYEAPPEYENWKDYITNKGYNT